MTAIRVLCLNVATKNFSDNLIFLVNRLQDDDSYGRQVKFIMNVYTPMWVSIKNNLFVQDGPKYLCRTLKLVKNEGKRDKIPVTQRSTFFSHPESIPLGMASENKQHIKEFA